MRNIKLMCLAIVLLALMANDSVLARGGHGGGGHGHGHLNLGINLGGYIGPGFYGYSGYGDYSRYGFGGYGFGGYGYGYPSYYSPYYAYPPAVIVPQHRQSIRRSHSPNLFSRKPITGTIARMRMATIPTSKVAQAVGCR